MAAAGATAGPAVDDAVEEVRGHEFAGVSVVAGTSRDSEEEGLDELLGP